MRLPSTVGSTGSTQAAAPTTETGATTATQGGHIIQPSRGQQIRRNIANFFSKIAGGFQKLHGRVQAHQAKQKLAANTRAAEGAATNVVKAFGKETIEAKLSALLPNLLAKAAKLDPQNPVGKAADLLNAAALAAGRGDDIEKINWKAMEPTIERMIDFRMGRRRAVEQSMVTMGFSAQHEVTTSADVNSMKGSVKSLLNVLQEQTDMRTTIDMRKKVSATASQAITATLANIKTAPTFEAKLGHLSDALDSYLTSPGINRGIVFRSDTAITKAISELLKTIEVEASDRIAGELKSALASIDAESLPDDVIDGHNKMREVAVTGEQFEMVTDVASHMITHLIGGTTPDAIATAASRVSKETVQVLQLIDAKVREHFPGDEAIAANAFIGSLFLRLQVPMISLATTRLTGGVKEQAVARTANAVTLSTFNAAAVGHDDVKSDRFQPEVATAYQDFVGEYADAVQSFRAAVLARDVD